MMVQGEEDTNVPPLRQVTDRRARRHGST